MENLEFIVDGMLGKVARWLRMLGYDTKYVNDMGDDDILKVALDEGRIILTRDYQLFRKANMHRIKAIFVEGDSHIEKLANISKQLNIRLEIDINKSRCPKCNAKIRVIGKEDIEDKIPKTTFKIYNDFWICTGCGQIYWRGSHWKKINSSLSQAREIVHKNSHNMM
jgi:uncharacterized protein with PIN domain